MAHNLNLQVLGGDYVKTALIAEWKVKQGDRVKKGDVLLVTETAKVTQEIESPCDGIVEKILFPAGEDVDIAVTIAVIGDGTGVAAASPEAPATVSVMPQAETKSGRERVFVTPVARAIANEKGADLEMMKRVLGLGRITRKDVLAFLTQKPAADAPTTPAPAGTVRVIPVRGRRRTIAQRMHLSTSTKPRVTHFIDADMEELFRVKEYLRQKYPDKAVGMTGLVAVAVTKALQEHPFMNATYENETIYEHSNVNLGIAVDMEEGLIVPVLKGCEGMPGIALCEALGSIAQRCKSGALSPGDYMGGTFTITNLGTTGIGHFTPIINDPEVGILAMGSMQKVLKLVDGQVRERRTMPLSLSFDHRAVDGAPAARFLNTVREIIENMFLLGF